jgi:L-amino acid N-acyltransferase
MSRVLEIYNREVLVSTATYDTEPRSPEEQERWFSHHGPSHPVLVVEDDSGVCGWASLSPWSDRAAYDRSVEVSEYVAEGSRGMGIGKALLEALVVEARRIGDHALLARISADNTVSIAMHAAQGFVVVGTLREVGLKFGRLLDVCIMEKLL